MSSNDMIFLVIFSILFIGVGCILLSRYLKKMKALSSPDTIIVEGVVVSSDFKTNSDDSASMYTYYPIYEFYINGEKNIYKSRYGCSRDKTGEKHLLCYNLQTKMIFEKENIKKDLIVGIIAIILGIVAAVYLFK